MTIYLQKLTHIFSAHYTLNMDTNQLIYDYFLQDRFTITMYVRN